MLLSKTSKNGSRIFLDPVRSSSQRDTLEVWFFFRPSVRPSRILGKTVKLSTRWKCIEQKLFQIDPGRGGTYSADQKLTQAGAELTLPTRNRPRTWRNTLFRPKLTRDVAEHTILTGNWPGTRRNTLCRPEIYQGRGGTHSADRKSTRDVAAPRRCIAPLDFMHGIYKRRALAPCDFSYSNLCMIDFGKFWPALISSRRIFPRRGQTFV